MAAVLRGYLQQREWGRAAELLLSCQDILRHVALSHWHTLHPAHQFDPLLHILCALRFDSLLVDMLVAAVQARDGAQSASLPAQERQELSTLLTVLVLVLANVIRSGALDCDANFVRMMMALQLLLLHSYRMQFGAAAASSEAWRPR